MRDDEYIIDFGGGFGLVCVCSWNKRNAQVVVVDLAKIMTCGRAV